jgi:hypothetical protein
MKRFDDEIERVLKRADWAAGLLSLAAMIVLTVGVVVGIGATVSAGTGTAFIWIILGAVTAAGLLYGTGMVITLLGMQLMETWRQSRQPAGDQSGK